MFKRAHVCSPIEMPTKSGWYKYDANTGRFEINPPSARDRAIAFLEEQVAYKNTFKFKVLTALMAITAPVAKIYHDLSFYCQSRILYRRLRKLGKPPFTVKPYPFSPKVPVRIPTDTQNH